MKSITRRGFIEKGAIGTLGVGMLPFSLKGSLQSDQTIKIGLIGTGGRGTGHVTTILALEGTEIVAVCDLFQAKADHAADLCVKAGKKRPKVYCKDENTWKELLDKEELDCVII